MNQIELIDNIKALLSNNEKIVAAWLYGSQVRDTQDLQSDYDIAVLFKQHINETLSNRARIEVLSGKLTDSVGEDVNVIDLSVAPVPLAMAVIDDNTLLVDKNSLLRMKCEQGIMSKWELDYQHSKVNSV